MGKQLIMAFVICSLLYIISPLSCKAYSQTYYTDDQLIELDSSDINLSINKSDIEMKDAFIDNFDVSEQGKVLVCLEGKTVNIYDRDGNFDYALDYTFSGSSCVFWDHENIVIYTFRGDNFTFLDEDGNIIRVCEYSGDKSQLINRIMKTNIIEFNDITYELEKNNWLLNFSDKYDTLVKNANNSIQKCISMIVLCQEF